MEYLFGSKTRARLLAILLAEDLEHPWIRLLVHLVGTGASSVQRDITELEKLGLVRRRRAGGACFIEIQEGHPLCEPLRELLRAHAAAERANGVPAQDVTDHLRRVEGDVRRTRPSTYVPGPERSGGLSATSARPVMQWRLVPEWDSEPTELRCDHTG
jgi:hypothetical protein